MLVPCGRRSRASFVMFWEFFFSCFSNFASILLLFLFFF
jgi:hypothetical protein